MKQKGWGDMTEQEAIDYFEAGSFTFEQIENMDLDVGKTYQVVGDKKHVSIFPTPEHIKSKMGYYIPRSDLKDAEGILKCIRHLCRKIWVTQVMIGDFIDTAMDKR